MRFRMPSRIRIFNPCCIPRHYLALSMNSLDLVCRNWVSCGWKPLFHDATGHDITTQASLCFITSSLHPKHPFKGSRYLSLLTPKPLPWPLSKLPVKAPAEWPTDTPRFSSGLITDASQIPFEYGIVLLMSHSTCGRDGVGATPERGRGGALE